MCPPLLLNLSSNLAHNKSVRHRYANDWLLTFQLLCLWTASVFLLSNTMYNCGCILCREGEYICSIWHLEKGKCNDGGTTDCDNAVGAKCVAEMQQGQTQSEVTWVGLAERSAIIVR